MEEPEKEGLLQPWYVNCYSMKWFFLQCAFPETWKQRPHEIQITLLSCKGVNGGEKKWKCDFY